ncbi:Glutamate--tRNA ligase [Trichinella spiralis]|uniref:Glutamate--tRNA ligase n=1 Tax=Trichinella spiralis TaxID=6334 RepID=A0ABR3KC17_TRISP
MATFAFDHTSLLVHTEMLTLRALKLILIKRVTLHCDDADSNSEEAAIYSELENEYGLRQELATEKDAFSLFIDENMSMLHWEPSYGQVLTKITCLQLIYSMLRLTTSNLRRSQSDGRNGSQRLIIDEQLYGFRG